MLNPISFIRNRKQEQKDKAAYERLTGLINRSKCTDADAEAIAEILHESYGADIYLFYENRYGLRALASCVSSSGKEERVKKKVYEQYESSGLQNITDFAEALKADDYFAGHFAIVPFGGGMSEVEYGMILAGSPDADSKEVPVIGERVVEKVVGWMREYFGTNLNSERDRTTDLPSMYKAQEYIEERMSQSDDKWYVFAFQVLERQDVGDKKVQLDEDLRCVVRYVRDSGMFTGEVYSIQDDVIFGIRKYGSDLDDARLVLDVRHDAGVCYDYLRKKQGGILITMVCVLYKRIDGGDGIREVRSKIQDSLNNVSMKDNGISVWEPERQRGNSPAPVHIVSKYSSFVPLEMIERAKIDEKLPEKKQEKGGGLEGRSVNALPQKGKGLEIPEEETDMVPGEDGGESSGESGPVTPERVDVDEDEDRIIEVPYSETEKAESLPGEVSPEDGESIPEQPAEGMSPETGDAETEGKLPEETEGREVPEGDAGVEKQPEGEPSSDKAEGDDPVPLPAEGKAMPEERPGFAEPDKEKEQAAPPEGEEKASEPGSNIKPDEPERGERNPEKKPVPEIQIPEGDEGRGGW